MTKKQKSGQSKRIDGLIRKLTFTIDNGAKLTKSQKDQLTDLLKSPDKKTSSKETSSKETSSKETSSKENTEIQ